MRPSLTAVLAVSASALALIALAIYFDLGHVADKMLALPVPVLLAVFSLILLNTLVGAARLGILLQGLRHPISWPESVRASLLGAVGGLLFFQIVGQTFTRSVLLKPNGVSAPTVLFATMIERAIALVYMLGLCVLGALYLHYKIALDLEDGGAGLVRLLVSIAAAFAAAAAIGYRRQAMSFARQCMGQLRPRHMIAISAITLTAHMCMLLGYVTLARHFAPEASLLSLGAAAGIIMLIASLPISFAGWGLRELSAVPVFAVVGLPAESAIAISATVGFTALGALGLLAATASLVPRTSSSATRATGPDVMGRAHSPDHYRALAWALPLLTATAVFFQFRLPSEGGGINVNLADVIVPAGAFAAFAALRRERLTLASWRLDALSLWLLVATCIISLALVIGYFNVGFSAWALWNRWLGWFVLLSYGMTGALLCRREDPDEALPMLATVMAVSAVVISLGDWCLMNLAGFLGPAWAALVPGRLEGFAQNPNAFAFQLLVALGMLMATRLCVRRRRLAFSNLDGFLAGFMVAALVLAQSRAGWIGLALLLLLLLGLRFLPVRTLIGIAAVALVTLSVPELLRLSLNAAGVDAPMAGGTRTLHGISLNTGMELTTNTQRWETLLGGLRTWLEAPLFGAGLGAFVERYKDIHGYALVIHNTPVWLLAELGLVGFAVFAYAYIAVGLRAARDVIARACGPRQLGIVLLLVLAATMSMFHEIFYQRILWFSLGALLVMRGAERPLPSGMRDLPPDGASDDHPPGPEPSPEPSPGPSRSERGI